MTVIEALEAEMVTLMREVDSEKHTEEIDNDSDPRIARISEIMLIIEVSFPEKFMEIAKRHFVIGEECR